MRAILSSLNQTGVFEPETVQAMSMALDEVCEALRIDGDAHARETIAIRIIDLARQGERNADRLRDRVLQEANAAQRA
jgi:hypothetical protein